MLALWKGETNAGMHIVRLLQFMVSYLWGRVMCKFKFLSIWYRHGDGWGAHEWSRNTLANSSESHFLRLNYSIPNETEETVIAQLQPAVKNREMRKRIVRSTVDQLARAHWTLHQNSRSSFKNLPNFLPPAVHWKYGILEPKFPLENWSECSLWPEIGYSLTGEAGLFYVRYWTDGVIKRAGGEWEKIIYLW